MLPVTDFDELNRLVGYERSMPIGKYFSEMRISNAQKRKRISLARRLEEEMVWLMSYMFYARQQGVSVSMDAITEIRNRYRAVLGDALIDLYIAAHIDSISADIVDATNRHKDDPYYYSKDRARLIAEEESNSIWQYTDYEQAVKNKKYKTWLTIMDGHQRESHGMVNGITIPINEEFVLEGGTCQFPRSDSLPDDERCGCRCSLRFS